MQARRRICIAGIVQGVGFRPHVYRLAHRLALSGHVKNTASGVAIEAQGLDSALQEFEQHLKTDAPPLARIASVSVEELSCLPEAGFTILDSESGAQAGTMIAPDIATCPDCIRELLDPADRRHGYPFINCTNCGPRFTIIRQIPYDRFNTSMSPFAMCPACQAEYEDPLNRRFHAQPNACWECGPQLTLCKAGGEFMGGDPLTGVIECLANGGIAAIKGLGGFHLACDATNSAAVEELRRRKRRFEKPLAIMVRDVHRAEMFCNVNDAERTELESPQRPIVLLRRRPCAKIPEAVAPRNSQLGVFLPYTPLHHLLFARGNFKALVMTSANLSDEPICIDNSEALERLHEIADLFLLHDREILLRCDDSVVCFDGSHVSMVRRSRGFVPVPITLAGPSAPVLAVGGELKNAICIVKGSHAFMGQHIGDLEDLAGYKFFEESIAHLQAILEVEPAVIAHDLHPGYLSTRWAQEQRHVPTIAVQHHHAHVASCMAENQLTGPVIGVVLDGTGYGTDGNVWGGEIMVADLDGFERKAHLEYAPMPGGAQAIREPWRMTVAYLARAGNGCLEQGLPFLASIPESQIRLIRQIAERQIRSPLTSSCGRLFDAVAALIGLRTHASFEAQAAQELEACCERSSDRGEYEFQFRGEEEIEIGTNLLFEQIVADLKSGVSPESISRRFHAGLVSAIARVVRAIASRTGIQQVCLSGGCLLNRYLSSQLSFRLKESELDVYEQRQAPCGDGGLSLGQVVIAARRFHAPPADAVTQSIRPVEIYSAGSAR